MKFLDTIQRLERLDHLIKTKATGDIKTLAVKLDVSERTIYNLLEQLRDLGAEIDYNKFRKTYNYLVEFDLKINIFRSI